MKQEIEGIRKKSLIPTHHWGWFFWVWFIGFMIIFSSIFPRSTFEEVFIYDVISSIAVYYIFFHPHEEIDPDYDPFKEIRQKRKDL